MALLPFEISDLVRGIEGGFDWICGNVGKIVING